MPTSGPAAPKPQPSPLLAVAAAPGREGRVLHVRGLQPLGERLIPIRTSKWWRWRRCLWRDLRQWRRRRLCGCRRGGGGEGVSLRRRELPRAHVQHAQQPDRKFYRCRIRLRNYSGGCNFFEWCDAPSPCPSSARSNTVFRSETLLADMFCPCDAGTCLILITKTGKNVGKQFYRCPANQDIITQGGSSCGLFKWCDDQQLRTSAPLQASSQYQTDVYLKWPKFQQWAKDCPNQSSDPYPDKAGNFNFIELARCVFQVW